MTASLAIQFQKVGARASEAPPSLPPWSLAIGDSEQARFALYSVVMNPQLTHDHWNHQHTNSIILCE